jgi:hypothetical protein
VPAIVAGAAIAAPIGLIDPGARPAIGCLSAIRKHGFQVDCLLFR